MIFRGFPGILVMVGWLSAPALQAAILLDAETLQPDKYAFQKKKAQAPSWEKKYKLVQVNTLVTDARAAYANGNVEKCIELLEKADELAQGAPSIHRIMIQTLLTVGQQDAAEKKAKIAQKQFPGNMLLMDYLGDVNVFLGNLQVARELYEDVLGQQPDASVPHKVPTVPAAGPAGTAFVFDARLWHGAAPNKTDTSRFGITTEFVCPQFRPLENYSRGLRPEVFARCSPERLKRLGFSAWSSYGHTGDPDAEVTGDGSVAVGELYRA